MVRERSQLVDCAGELGFVDGSVRVSAERVHALRYGAAYRVACSSAPEHGHAHKNGTHHRRAKARSFVNTHVEVEVLRKLGCDLPCGLPDETTERE